MEEEERECIQFVLFISILRSLVVIVGSDSKNMFGYFEWNEKAGGEWEQYNKKLRTSY